MSTLVLPQSMVADREAGIKANAQHVDDNFNALANAVNGKLDLDGSSTPTADISMASHKLTNVATPTASGDAATKGYTDSALLLKADLASPAFTGTPTAPTVASVADKSTKLATTKFVVDVLESIYPVGSLYIGTQNSCPMGALFGSWSLVAQNKALWTGDGTNGDTIIAPGLPNITGVIKPGTAPDSRNSASGAFAIDSTYTGSRAGGSGSNSCTAYNIDASRSSSIYGASSTVQPPAYVVNVWRRTA
jgi:hypothetical protein